MTRLACLLLCCLAVGCAPAGRGRGPGGDAGTPGGPDAAALPAGCVDEARLVYVIDADGTLSSFTPDQADVSQSKFQAVGKLACPTQIGGQPFSMAVDRSATAWVLYVGGDPFAPSSELFRVNTLTGACTATSYQPGQAGFEQFGMGFAADVVGGAEETLFVAGGGPPDPFTGQVPSTDLGRIALSTLTLNSLARLSGRPELTGTGDGRLWGFFPDELSPRVAALDKSGGQEGQTFELPSLTGTPEAWAFAFWGGDFWIFLKRSTDAATVVHHLRASDGTIRSLSTNSRKIVGAGVSTCAPIAPIQ